MPAYRGACFYGRQGLADSRAVTCPVTYTATESDMLYPHLDRLLPLRDGQTIRRIGDDRTRKDALIAETVERHPATAGVARESFALTEGPGVRFQFVDRREGQVLLHHAGSHDAPAVLVLHDAPGSAAVLARPGGLVERLATSFLVLAPDLPGSGGSDPIGAVTSLDAWADVLAEVCAQAGVARCCVYGIGIGASLAVHLAVRHPALASHVVLDGLALPDPEQRAQLRQRYAPPITIEADGSHWYRTWLMLRDQQIFFPWFASRAADQRRVAADFGGDPLHAWAFEVMKQHGHYHELIEAAFDHDAAADLAALRVPLAVCHDPRVPFFAYDAALRALTIGATDLPVGPAEQGDALLRFVRQGEAARSVPSSPARVLS